MTDTAFPAPSPALQSVLPFNFARLLPTSEDDTEIALIGASVCGDDSLAESFWIHDGWSVRVAKTYFALLCATYTGWPVRVTVIAHDGDMVFADFLRDSDGNRTEGPLS
jgi:hypothetical protein